jgi:hypothetical protein
VQSASHYLANSVEFGTANGETIFVVVLLSKTNVTVCGSPTVEGLTHVTLSPALICIFSGINTVNGAVEFLLLIALCVWHSYSLYLLS